MVVGAFPTVTEKFIVDQITGLLDRGHEVAIITAKSRFNDEKIIHQSITDYQLEQKVVIPEKVYETSLYRAALKDIIKFPGESFKIARTVRNNDRSLYGKLKPLLGKSNFDIIHCQFLYHLPIAFGYLDAGLIKGTLVCSVRGADVRDKWIHRYKDIYKSGFELSGKIMPVAENFRERLIQLGCPEKKIEVVRSGIEVDSYLFNTRSYENEQETLRIVSVGRLVDKKGHKYLLEAVKKIHDKGIPCRLDLFGDGPEVENLTRQINNLNAQKYIFIRGFADKNKIKKALANAHIAVNVSVTTEDGNREGVPNSLKEAMASGLPVIGTRHSGIPELIDDEENGFLCEERSVDQLVKAIEKVRKAYSDGSINEIIDKAYNKVKHEYDNALVVKHLEEIYDQVLS